MKTKTKIRLVKVLVVLLYAVLIFVPMMRAQFEEVNIVNSQILYNSEKHGDDMILTCDKEVVSGTVTIRVYKDSEVIKTIVKNFDDNEGKTFTITILDEDIPEYATEYKLFDARVTTKTQETVEIICWLPLIICLIFVPFIFRMNVYETSVDGNQVEVYVGIKKKTMRVNGNLVQEVKKIFYIKPIILEYNLQGKTIVAEIGGYGKIKFSTKQNETEKPQDSETIVEDDATEPDDLSKEENMANELFAKANDNQEEKKEDEKEKKPKKQKETKQTIKTVDDKSEEN